MKTTKQFGFTLIELMIAVTVVAILAAIAYPSYQTQVRKSRMSQAQADLLTASQFMERCFASNNTYANCVLPFNSSPSTGTAYYGVRVDTVGRTQFTVTATPTLAGNQNQQICGTLTLDQAGRKTFSGSATASQCW